MKKSIQRSVMWTSVGFIAIMIFCIVNMLYKFSFIDLSYLLVVIGFFVVYLKKVKELN